MLDWALWYCRQGLEVFPVHRIRDNGLCSCGDPGCSSPGKHPIISNGVRGASADLGLARDRWGLYPKANIGIHTNKLIVLDVDGSAGVESLDRLCSEDVPFGFEPRKKVLERSPQVRTGGRGAHYFFKPRPGTNLPNKVGFMPGLDIRSEGGYVVAPPSNHASGDMYTWVAGLQEQRVPRVPLWLVKTVQATSNIRVLPNQDSGGIRRIEIQALALIEEGTRHDSLKSLCGRLFWEGRGSDEVWVVLNTINQTLCKPPYPEKSLKKIFDWTNKREQMKRRAV